MERKFLFFPFLGIFQPTFPWNEAIVVFYNFLNFFSHFFEIFYNAVELERNGMIIFIFPLSKPFPTYFGLKVGHNGISSFFAIFFRFYITRRMGTKRNDNFYFLSFSAFSYLFWLVLKPQRYFLIFLIFWLFYWNFLLRVGLERKGTITFIFLLSHPFPTYFALKWIHNDIF